MSKADRVVEVIVLIGLLVLLVALATNGDHYCVREGVAACKF